MSSIEDLLRTTTPHGDRGSSSTEEAAVHDATEQLIRRATDEGLVDVAWANIDSPIGPLFVATTPRGLVAITFGEGHDTLEQLAARVSPRVLEAPANLDPVRRQLDEYFEGQRREFELDLDWALTSGFRLRVLRSLVSEVHYGEVTSYQELAALVGSPRASRAVGTAMATNPLPLVVPCHRVLRTGGALGGYGGGLDSKRYLLTLEGAQRR